MITATYSRAIKGVDLHTGSILKHRLLFTWTDNAIIVIIIAIANVYNATSRQTQQRHSRPNRVKPRLKRMVFKRLRIRRQREAVSLCGRLLGNLLQEGGPTTGKLKMFSSSISSANSKEINQVTIPHTILPILHFPVHCWLAIDIPRVSENKCHL